MIQSSEYKFCYQLCLRAYQARKIWRCISTVFCWIIILFVIIAAQTGAWFRVFVGSATASLVISHVGGRKPPAGPSPMHATSSLRFSSVHDQDQTMPARFATQNVQISIGILHVVTTLAKLHCAPKTTLAFVGESSVPGFFG